MDLSKIKVFCIDLDGTLTDGRYGVDENGTVTKFFHTRDFYAMRILREQGYKVFIITGAFDKAGIKKAEQSKTSIFTNVQNKVSFIEENILGPNKHTWENVAFIGDAENDIEALKKAGFSATTQDCIDSIGEVHYQSHRKGGDAAVHEIIEWFLNKQGKTLVPPHVLPKCGADR